MDMASKGTKLKRSANLAATVAFAGALLGSTIMGCTTFSATGRIIREAYAANYAEMSENAEPLNPRRLAVRVAEGSPAEPKKRIYEIDQNPKFGTGIVRNPEAAVDSKGNILIRYGSFFSDKNYKEELAAVGLVEVDRSGIYELHDIGSGETVTLFDGYSRLAKYVFAQERKGTPEEKEELHNLLREKNLLPVSIRLPQRSCTSPAELKVYDLNTREVREIYIPYGKEPTELWQLECGVGPHCAMYIEAIKADKKHGEQPK